jgi:exosortase
MTTAAVTRRTPNVAALAPLALPAVALLWAYWTTLADLLHTWNSNPQYSHGFLVPAFAAFLLWHRRDKLDVQALRPSILGLVVLATALAVKLVGTYGHYVSLDPLSLIPCVAGLVLLLGGAAAWRWAWPAVLFLTFMIPLPYFAAVAMSEQLQNFATITSTFVMQTLGLPALAEGNVILLNDQRIGIVEACSGLRMLVVFFALSTAMVLVVKRHWSDKLVIALSAIPIALVSNIIRIVATGIMYEYGDHDFAHRFFHDFAGWLMMPLGLAMLWVELWLLGALFVTVPAPAVPRHPGTPRRAVPRTASGRASRTAAPRTTEQPLKSN